jgi:glyoxylase-like metal-dependent hydrolase (beta-lactamase superfamily II)
LFTDIHSLASNLVVIEGRHPTLLWEACDVPSIVVYRAARTLYVLDTGVGPEQRTVLESQIASLGQGAEEIVLVNSHGHFDHLGNNDLVQRASIPRKRHLISKESAPNADIRTELFEMYGRGKDYFSYIDGLPLPADKISGLLKALGAPSIAPATLEELGGKIRESGVLPALNNFMPSIVVDVLMATYPAVFPSLETMTFLEDVSAPAPIKIAGAQWIGWSLDGEASEVYVLRSGGHSRGGVVFYIPEHKFLMLADESTSVPIWPDTDPRRVIGTAQRALTMLNNGGLEWLCAGHFPMVPSKEPKELQASLQRVLGQAAQFSEAIEKEVAAHPEGLTVDELYEALRKDIPSTSYLTFLITNQFPVFSTFMKLTLLNHLLLYNFPSRKGTQGYIRFLPLVRG